VRKMQGRARFHWIQFALWLFAFLLVPLGLESVTPAHAATGVPGGQLFTSSGTGCQVTVSFLGAEAVFNDRLFLSATVPASGGTPTGTLLFNHGAPTGPTTISVPPSSELIFAISVDDPRNGPGIDATWYMGPGSRNADGQAHAIVTDNGDGTFTVAFEDIAIPSQFTDFNDLMFLFRGTCLTSGQGRMTGGGSVFTAAGVRVTHGFEIHCNPAQSPNNIEVNWGKGQNFHLTTLTSAQCLDDPSIQARPPSAGFDTFIGSGTGTLNGTPGARIQFTFTDAGEPGTKDSATIKIIDAGGNVVLQVSGQLDKGNQQAHNN